MDSALRIKQEFVGIKIETEFPSTTNNDNIQKNSCNVTCGDVKDFETHPFEFNDIASTSDISKIKQEPVKDEPEDDQPEYIEHNDLVVVNGTPLETNVKLTCAKGESKKHECEICPKKFDRAGKLVVHIRTHSEKKIYECNICFSQFTRKRALETHERTHNNYMCDICHIQFKGKSGHTMHMRSHTAQEPFECVICHKWYYKKSQIAEHIRTHAKQKPCTDDIGHNRFTPSDNLKSHGTNSGVVEISEPVNSNTLKNIKNEPLWIQREPEDLVERDPQQQYCVAPANNSIHADKPFECDICHGRFNLKAALVMHMYRHTKRYYKYKCNTCEKHFAQELQLTEHICVYTEELDERPHVCNICHKRFKTKKDCTRHMHVHTGEKPYQCYICLKSFATSNHLTGHLRIHRGDTRFVCHICHKGFYQAMKLEIHIRSHTGDKPYECEFCHKTFSLSGTLSMHLRLHTNERVRTKKLPKPSFSYDFVDVLQLL